MEIVKEKSKFKHFNNHIKRTARPAKHQGPKQSRRGEFAAPLDFDRLIDNFDRGLSGNFDEYEHDYNVEQNDNNYDDDYGYRDAGVLPRRKKKSSTWSNT